MTKQTASRGRSLTAPRVAPPAAGQALDFSADRVGAPPAGWTTGVTGLGRHRWQVAVDASGPSPRNVLKQSGVGDFPWCVRDGVALADGHVEVKFKPLAGEQDRAGGVVWRWKDGDNYYVARGNALEQNVSLYCTRDGRRNTIRYAAAPVATDQWHVLRVEFAGTRIAVVLDGTRFIEQEDARISGVGAVGLWTKADSATVFDDFSYGGTSQ